MIKTSTENDLVRFLYNDVSAEERADIQESLLTDNQLQNTVSELEEVVTALDNLIIKAPKDAVDRILYASKNHQPV